MIISSKHNKNFPVNKTRNYSPYWVFTHKWVYQYHWSPDFEGAVIVYRVLRVRSGSLARMLRISCEPSSLVILQLLLPLTKHWMLLGLIFSEST